jgi:hypothetical protein
MNNLSKIFKEKDDVKFRDKYTMCIFTVAKIKSMILYSETINEVDNWLERFVKIQD